MSLETKATNILSLVLPITVHKCKSWTVKNADRKKKLIYLKHGFGVEPYRSPGLPEKWAVELIKPETSSEAKMIKLKLLYFGHTMESEGSL